MPNDPSEPDVLICGAGPVGLTLASQLHRHGLSFRIVDRSEARTDLSKALVIWARSLELLATGLDVDPFVAAGIPATTSELRAGERLIGRIDLTPSESRFGCGVMLPQSETERILEEHLVSCGEQVERRTELAEFADLGAQVRCTLRLPDGRTESVQPRFLVGCDGAHSMVRHGLGLEFPGAVDLHHWYLADVRIAGAMPDATVLVCWHRAGLAVFFRIKEDRWRVVAAKELVDPDAPRRDPTLGEMQRLVDERGPRGLRLHDPVWLAEFRINERKVDRYRVGRVCLAGDAAHVHSPAGGQGMNTGMQDACNLAWKLALVKAGVASDALLESYSSERSAVGDQVLNAAGRVTQVATLRDPLLQALRNRVASLALRIPFVQSSIRGLLSELAIAYPQSPITGTDERSRHSGEIAPGDRLPDAALVDREGKPARLHDLLVDRRILALLVSSDDPEEDVRVVRSAIPEPWRPHVRVAMIAAKPPSGLPPADATLIQTNGSCARRLGFRAPGLVAVRPDGYVGQLTDLGSSAALGRWLAKL
jgi:2-polyprenyl-6-methoxyphenol hydroxylase-like FAD-dependent oxidoreductase